MNEYITVKIIRPDISGLTPDRRRQLLTNLSTEIAKQVIDGEEKRLVQESCEYWERYFAEWAIRDFVNEVMHAELNKRN